MSDTLSRVKLQLRPVNGSSVNGNINGNGGDNSTPSSPASKLLINHGKPNYTIQRSPKAQQNGGTNPLSTELQNNNRNNYYPYKSAGVKGTTGIITTGTGTLKSNDAANNNNNNYNSSENGDNLVIQSTKFNGVFKPANVQQLENKEDADNQVVLRHVPKPEPAATALNGNDENVPEFILRQRRIQERLAKENILDFESRRSGYFTHVVISPTSPNRTSLVETMSSPPIVPALEIPPPAKEIKEGSIAEENSVERALDESLAAVTNGNVEEEEVAKAIEEVNKAVAGEADNEKPEVNVIEEENIVVSEKVSEIEVNNVQTVVEQHKFEEHNTNEINERKVEPVNVEDSKLVEEQIPAVSIVVTSAPLIESEVSSRSADESGIDAVEEQANVQTEVTVINTSHINEVVSEETPIPDVHEQSVVVEQFKENGHGAEEEVPKLNGHAADDLTISHTNYKVNDLSNGLAAPSLPTPDPSGALGVNYEPKTVVSFSKDLGEPNKYPDTVKVVKTVKEGDETKATDELKDLAKLKFDIKADNEDVQVTPVLRTE